MPLRPRLANTKLPLRPRLGLEIALILAIKFCLLYFIWLTWFSEPTARHMQMNPDTVARAVLSSRPTPPEPPARSDSRAAQR